MLPEAESGLLATLYSLFFGIMTPFYGRLGDRYGLRRLYITGMVIFGVSSLLATTVPTSAFPLLVLFRVGQGIGSAAIPPLGTALIMRRIPSARRGASIGLIAASVGAGQAILTIAGWSANRVRLVARGLYGQCRHHDSHPIPISHVP